MQFDDIKVSGNMKKINTLIILLLSICVITGIFGIQIPARAEDPTGTGDIIIAEKVSPSDLIAGDRIMIVCESNDMALCLDAVTSARLSAGKVTTGRTATRQVLTAIPENAAVLELAGAENGWYLMGSTGYLTSSADGKALFFTQDLQEGSRWQFKDDVFLYNPSASYSNGSTTFRNYYPEFYSSYFTVYGKGSNSNLAQFTMCFYRMGNRMPEEPLVQEICYSLPVFETSDVHGYLANVTDDGQTQYLLACISNRVNAARRNGRDKAILLDGGDIYQGMTMSNLTNGNALSAAYALMGYDAAALGNHEFDWGVENTVDSNGTMMDYDLGDGWQGVNNIPIVVSNLYRNGGKVSWGRDYIILEKTAVDDEGNELPVKVAVIGIAGDYGSSIMTDRFSGAGYSIILDYAEVNALADQLESSGACDATILLGHETAVTMANALGENTAIDLVLGGHTHRNACGATSWGLPYMEPSCNGKAYARVDMVFSLEEGITRFSRVENAAVVSVPALTNTEGNAGLLDQQIVALTDDVVELISGLLETKVGTITVSALRYVYLPGSGERSTTCGNWMSSIVARINDADIGFVNSGGLRADFEVDSESGERDISRSDVYTMFPFDNKIYLFELTGEDLLTAFTYALTANGRTLFSEMSGITCYYTDNRVNAIVVPGNLVIYADGFWLNDWRTRTMTVSASEFIVTTDRPDGNLSNPFCSWQNTERLLAFDKVDNVSAIEVLESEAAVNNGYLEIDTTPHFVNSVYDPSLVGEGIYVLPENIQVIESEAFENSALQVLVVPGGCLSIQDGAFRNCKQLREIWLPKNCSVDPFAFEGCSSLSAVYAPAGGTSEAWVITWEKE